MRTLLVVALAVAVPVATITAAPSPAIEPAAAVRVHGADRTDQAWADLAIVIKNLPTTTTTTTPPAPAPRASAPTPSDGSVWDQLAQCESGGRWDYPPVAGGFSGGVMFHIGTWHSMGGGAYAPDAYLATREQQIEIAERTLAVSGWGAWPGCSRRLGLR